MTIVGRHTDRNGRSTGERVAAVRSCGRPVTDEERAAATRLLDVMLDAADLHGVSLDAFDWVCDMPAACVDVVRSQTRRD
jgi:hypothetical protein